MKALPEKWQGTVFMMEHMAGMVRATFVYIVFYNVFALFTFRSFLSSSVYLPYRVYSKYAVWLTRDKQG